MSIEDFKTLMDEFDPASLLPELDTIIGKISFIARIAVMIGPVVLLIMGLLYLFASPKEANHYLGFRCYYGMGSVEAWRFSQQLAGIVFGGLGLILGVIMLLISFSFGKLGTIELLTRAVWCVVWEAVLTAISFAAVNIMVAMRFDGRGDLRSNTKQRV